MGRRELPIDRDSDALARFAADLRELRRAAGSPSYRELARRAHYSATTLSVAAGGRVLPSLPVLRAYVHACGGDIDMWRERWQRLATGDAPEFVARPTARTRLRDAAVAMAAIGLLAASLAVVSGAASSAGPLTPESPQPLSNVVFNAALAADCPAVPGATVDVVIENLPAWSVGTRGGYDGEGCHGEYHFLAQPGPHSRNSVIWSVSGLDARPLTCHLSIHIPDSPHAAGLGHYTVATGGQVIDRPVIDQGRHHGDWVGHGPYTVTEGNLNVRLDTTGTDEITAGTVRVHCV